MRDKSYLERILGIVCSVFDAYSAVLFMPAKNGEEYYLAARFSLGDNINPDAVIKAGQGLVGWIARDGQPMLLNNFDQQRSVLGYYPPKKEASIKAFMGAPLPQGGGALCLDSKRSYSFSEKDQKILHLFAELVHDVHTRFIQAEESLGEYHYYQCLQLIQSLRTRYTRWPDFLRHLLAMLSEATGFEYCFLAARDERGRRYFLEGANQPIIPGSEQEVRLDINAGLVGWVFKNNGAVYSDDMSSANVSPLFGGNLKTPAFKSFMCLPLVVHKVPRGVLGFADPGHVVITERLKVFAHMVSVHLALFLENLYLKNRLRMAEQAMHASNT